MDAFMDALVSGRTKTIPPEYDWFASLLGDWDFDYFDNYGSPTPRQLKGEWFFRRVLNGAGIQDLFICPSRATMETNPQSDGEYGVAIRMFNSDQHCYDMTYACEKYMKRLVFRMEGGKLVGTVLDNPTEKWVFSERMEDSFHWQNVTVLADGGWQINSDIYAKRRVET